MKNLGSSRRLPVLGVVAALLVPGIVPARAQGEDVTGSDRAALSECLRESLTSPGACIGSIAVICARAGGEGVRREAEVACARREAAVWRERLNAASAAFARQLDSESSERFVALQRAWENYTVQKCAFFGEIQPAARAAAMQAGCSLREVASRANEVERELRQKGEASRRRSGQPPRIER